MEIRSSVHSASVENGDRSTGSPLPLRNVPTSPAEVRSTCTGDAKSREAEQNSADEEGGGAARGIRTPDPVITNDVLYQLSYCGDRGRADEAARNVGS